MPIRYWHRVGTTTAWRYVTETVALLAAGAPKLDAALQAAKQAKHAFVVLDGTLIPSTASPPTGRSAPASTARTG